MTRFNTIEIQTTFYQPPSVELARKWRSLAPSGFQFCMKAWQLITHTPASPTYRRLKQAIDPAEKHLYGNFQATGPVLNAWHRTREIAEALDAQVIVFQCPASFFPTEANLRNLEDFFQRMDRGGRRIAWEPRGEAWGSELIRRICERHSLIDCVDPFLRDSVTEADVYWRLHGKGGYRYRYTEADLAELGEKLSAQARSDGDRYVMFNNISSKEDALRFLSLIGR